MVKRKKNQNKPKQLSDPKQSEKKNDIVVENAESVRFSDEPPLKKVFIYI